MIAKSKRFEMVLAIGLGLLLASCSSKEKTNISENMGVGPTQADAASSAPAAVENDLKMVHFATNAYNLSRDSRDALKYDAKWLKGHPGNVEVDGYCDERGSQSYNMDLGNKRAKAVRNYLVRLGVKSSRLQVVSYGFDRPIDPGHDESAWAQNRRAVPVVSTQNLTKAD